MASVPTGKLKLPPSLAAKNNMEESQSPLGETPPTPATALSSKLMDVFIAPGEVFDDVKASPPKPVTWIVPLAISIVLSIVFALVVYSQPAIIQRMTDMQSQKYQEMVKQGKMTQQQVDQAQSITQKFMGPTFFKIVGVFGALFGNTAKLFIVALVLWLLGKFAFHAAIDFKQTLEVSGLSLMISALGTLVALLLVSIKGNLMVNLGPSLFIDNLDPTNKMHMILGALNLFTIWQIAVLSIGLGKLSGTGWLKPALCLFALWAVLTFGFILVIPTK